MGTILIDACTTLPLHHCPLVVKDWWCSLRDVFSFPFSTESGLDIYSHFWDYFSFFCLSLFTSLTTFHHSQLLCLPLSITLHLWFLMLRVHFFPSITCQTLPCSLWWPLKVTFSGFWEIVLVLPGAPDIVLPCPRGYALLLWTGTCPYGGGIYAFHMDSLLGLRVMFTCTR